MQLSFASWFYIGCKKSIERSYVYYSFGFSHQIYVRAGGWDPERHDDWRLHCVLIEEKEHLASGVTLWHTNSMEDKYLVIAAFY